MLFSKYLVEKMRTSQRYKKNIILKYLKARDQLEHDMVNFHDKVQVLNVYLGTGALWICLGNSGIPNPGKIPAFQSRVPI